MSDTDPSPLGDYLRARRALLKPEDVGLKSLNVRRVAGLRRDEVAQLAGISQEYYLRLEQGRDRQPSGQVIEALGRALQLDDGALEYLRRLARIASGEHKHQTEPEMADRIEEGLRALLAQWTDTPAYIMDGNQDVIVVNELATAMTGGGLAEGVNLPLAVFTPEARLGFEDWDETAARTVATLRFNSDPFDRRLQEIVGLLSVRDADFRRLWARHDAHPHHLGPVRQFVAGFGFVTLDCQTLLVPGGRGHVLVAFNATPATEGETALNALRRQEAISRDTATTGDAAPYAPIRNAVLGNERTTLDHVDAIAG
ncbi:helix-turn-helix transcriptional regulator [Curtobacterium flaccumfaciens]|uniref:helix-turn-helix transcriptional regulator n=1 Tax=Curtobacterium flaccumfaciens TaxID=2035 RepID=UPI0039932F06